jgi:predicted DNA-binding transcriptional regulator YafY
MAEKRPTSWGQQRRLELIDFRLYWEGRINRADLTEHFGISVPQASIDLARYQELAPDNATYDGREKCYLAMPGFKPALSEQSSDFYLDQLLALATGTLARDSVFMGWAPPTDVARSIHRRVPTDVLLAVLRGIHQQLSLQIDYQSFTQPAPTQRTISPHAISFDGFRWHTRAYCHTRNAFRDFVLARILSIRPGAQSDIDPQLDDDWNTFVEVKIAPHPDLTEAQRRAIEIDYAMSDGVAVLPTRRALLFYVLRHLGLTLAPKNEAAAQQIVLANKDKLAPYLSVSTGQPPNDEGEI